MLRGLIVTPHSALRTPHSALDMICPVCGHANLPGVEQCSNCLFDLMAIDRPIPSDRVEASLVSDPVAVLLPKQPVTVHIDATLGEAIAKMISQSVGAMLVLSDTGELVGILTERDFLTKVAGSPDFFKLPVRDFMTATPKRPPWAIRSPSRWQRWTAAATATSRSPLRANRWVWCRSGTCSATWCTCASD